MSELTTGARAMAALVRGLGYLQRIVVILVPWANLDLDLCLISNARGDREVSDEEMLGTGVRDKRNDEVLAKRSRCTRKMTSSLVFVLIQSMASTYWFMKTYIVVLPSCVGSVCSRDCCFGRDLDTMSAIFVNTDRLNNIEKMENLMGKYHFV